MAFLTGIGALLGGATEEAGRIKQERFQKEQADVNLTTSMLQHIIENPNILDPNIKAQAQHAWRDVVMEHLFPDQFKGDKKNSVRSLVDKFVGQQQTGPAMAGAVQTAFGGPGGQPGVGRGRATTQVGASTTPQQPSVPAPPPGPPVAPTGSSGGLPPSPGQAGVGTNVPTVGGFASPLDVQAAQERQKAQIENEARLQYGDEAWKRIEPNLPPGTTDQQKAQIQASLRGAQMTPQPVPTLTHIPSTDPNTGLATTKIYKETAQGPVLVDTIPGPPTAEMQQMSEDAMGLKNAVDANPDSDMGKAFKGMDLKDIRASLQFKRYTDQELKLQTQKMQMEANISLKKLYEENVKSLIDARKQQPLVRLAEKIQSEAESEYNKRMAEYTKSPTEFVPGAKGPAMLRRKPEPNREQIYNEIAIRNGVTGQLLQNILGSSLLKGAQAPPKVGDIVSGYRYMGGDPSQQTSWQPVQPK